MDLRQRRYSPQPFQEHNSTNQMPISPDQLPHKHEWADGLKSVAQFDSPVYGIGGLGSQRGSSTFGASSNGLQQLVTVNHTQNHNQTGSIMDAANSLAGWKRQPSTAIGGSIVSNSQQSGTHSPYLKDQNTNPGNGASSTNNPNYYLSCSLSELNLELDNNMNELIFLLGRRKALISAKKRRFKDQVEQSIRRNGHQNRPGDNSSHSPLTSLDPTIQTDEDFAKITSFCRDQKSATNVLNRMLRVLPNLHTSKVDEQHRSEHFWGKNRRIEGDIDGILERLKGVDKNLEKENGDVTQLCREIDSIEENLKTFVGSNPVECLPKVESLLQAKSSKYDVLNRRIKDRENSKDKKIELVSRIMGALSELTKTRQERLGQIARFFGVGDTSELVGAGSALANGNGTIVANELTVAIEELTKIRDKSQQLLMSEQQCWTQIDQLEQQQQRLYNQLLKRQSDQAKAYHDVSGIVTKRAKCMGILAQFQDIKDPNQTMRRFKEYKGLFVRLLDEETLLRQGLVKTSETAKTLGNILRTTETERQRRQQLLSQLQSVLHHRTQYEKAREQSRGLQLQQTRLIQEQSLHEQQLQTILTADADPGDIDTYKRLTALLARCQQERNRLTAMKESLHQQMQAMDREVVTLGSKIESEYGDLLEDVLPAKGQGLEWGWGSGEQVKRLRNRLKRMYKRMGLLGNSAVVNSGIE